MAGKEIGHVAQAITAVTGPVVTVADAAGYYKNAIVWLNNLLPTPTNDTFSTADTGGTLVPGTYYYRVSALNASGETLASTEASQVVPAGTNTNIVTVNWIAVPGATGYKVYGRATGAELLIATIGSGATVTYVDTGAVTPAGALPAANTTQTTARAIVTAVNTTSDTISVLFREILAGSVPTYGGSNASAYNGGTITQHEQFVYNSNDLPLS